MTLTKINFTMQMFMVLVYFAHMALSLKNSVILGGGSQLFTLRVPRLENSTKLHTITASASAQIGKPQVIHLVAPYMGHINTWTLDVHNGSVATSSKSLCYDTSAVNDEDAVDGSGYLPSTEEVEVGLFSNLQTNIKVEMTVQQEVFELQLYRDYEVTVSPVAPRVYQFLPPKANQSEDDIYQLKITSSKFKDNCMYVAINPPGCPWKDDATVVKNSKLWARMLEVGYFPIKYSDFPRGFTVSLVPLKNSSECFTRYNLSEGPSYGQDATKDLLLRLELNEGSYTLPVAVAIASILFFALFFLVIWVILWSKLSGNQSICGCLNDTNQTAPERPETKVEDEDRHAHSEGNGDVELQPMTDAQKYRNEPDKIYRAELCDRLIKVHEMRHTRNYPKMRRCHGEPVENGAVFLTHCEAAVERLRKEKLFIDDMTVNIQNPWHRRQRSKTYLLLIPLVALFYLVPSVQMVYSEFRKSVESGNMDLCYFNHGCSRMLGDLADFNHIISNSGYFIYGLFFIIMVFIKSRLLPDGHRTHEDHANSNGLVQQHSLFFTMGFTMVLQGGFSCVFHLCPSNVSLQFDTTMMYVLMVLVFVKIFQLRHPDTAYSAFHVMYVFSVVLVFEAVSLYSLEPTFRFLIYTLFALLYLFLMIFIAIDIYYYGAIKTSFIKMLKVAVEYAFTSNNWNYCLYKRKFILACAFIVINSGLLVWTLTRAYSDMDGPGRSLSTPLLVICGVNVFIYLVYYFVRKFGEIIRDYKMESNGEISDHGEQGNGETYKPVFKPYMRWLSVPFFLLALLCGIVAAYYYSQKHQSRNSTPPESRNKNQECEFMDFYDNHDMWHFFSSTALYLSFIGLLTIDDDLMYIPRKDIPVF